MKNCNKFTAARIDACNQQGNVSAHKKFKLFKMHNQAEGEWTI